MSMASRSLFRTRPTLCEKKSDICLSPWKELQKTPKTDGSVSFTRHFVYHTGDEFSVKVSNSVLGGPLCHRF